MTYNEIIKALQLGQNVYWTSIAYKVIEQNGKLYEVYKYNSSMCGLQESQYADCFIGV